MIRKLGKKAATMEGGGTKLAKGSFIILVGAFIFRIGGFIYRFLLAHLLGPVGYGLLGLTLPFQGFLIMLAAGGLPPAIAKYVAEYSAVDEKDMAKQVIITSTKVMVVLGIFFSILMFFMAKPIALNFYHKPELIIPLQLVALITPFSVFVGAFRGVFQGFYEMTYILVTRAIEQIFMIIFAVILVIIGWYVAGAVVGTVIGFMAASVSGFILFKKGIWGRFSEVQKKFTLKEEISLAKILLIFSFPVIITGFAELALYDIGTIIIGSYMPSVYAGYYNAASPIARLPLIISMSVATAVLPAASEALSLNNKSLLEKYVIQSYRYVTILVLPLCAGTILFSTPIISLLFGSDYIPGSDALKILAAGMLFFTIYTVSASVSQGVGKPYLPMIMLVIGTTMDLILSIILVPLYGINGAALATTITALFIMLSTSWKTLQITEVKLPLGNIAKIIFASILMGGFLIILPKTYIYLIVAIILAPFVYILILAFMGGFKKEDIRIMYRFAAKLGPLSRAFQKLIKFIERFTT
jgi:stage V sporulation protein B